MNGPYGLEGRRNSQRFPWEANAAGVPVVPDNPYAQRTPAQPLGPNVRVDLPRERSGGTSPVQVTGSGFAPNETVTLRGSAVPAFLLPTDNAIAPVKRLTCAPQTLGPLAVTADDTGAFTVTLDVRNYPGTALDIRLEVSGATSGETVYAGTGGGTLPQLEALPPGCGG